MWFSSSSGSLAKDPHFDLMFSVAVYAFPAGLIPNGCEGTAVATSSSSCWTCTGTVSFLFLAGCDSAEAKPGSCRMPGAIVKRRRGQNVAGSERVACCVTRRQIKANVRRRRVTGQTTDVKGETLELLDAPRSKIISACGSLARFWVFLQSLFRPALSFTHRQLFKHTTHINGSGYLTVPLLLQHNQFSPRLQAAPVVFHTPNRNHG